MAVPGAESQLQPGACRSPELVAGTLAMVLNALGVDPGRKWKGPWRWFSHLAKPQPKADPGRTDPELLQIGHVQVKTSWTAVNRSRS